MIDTYMRHTTFSLWCHFWQCPWDSGSASAERMGKGRWAGFDAGPRWHGCFWT